MNDLLTSIERHAPCDSNSQESDPALCRTCGKRTGITASLPGSDEHEDSLVASAASMSAVYFHDHLLYYVDQTAVFSKPHYQEALLSDGHGSVTSRGPTLLGVVSQHKKAELARGSREQAHRGERGCRPL